MFATFMNVSVHMILGLDPGLDTLQQVNTASPDPCTAEVPEAKRRTVSDENISVLGDQVPLPQTFLSSLEVKCPASKLRLPGSSLKGDYTIVSFNRKFWKSVLLIIETNITRARGIFKLFANIVCLVPGVVI